jgi:ArsR family transcriptional regulator
MTLVSAPAISPAAVRDLALLFAALAEPARVRILLILAERGEVGPAELVEALGLAAPTVSYHLAELRLHGLVTARRAHKRLFYRLTERAAADDGDGAPALLAVRNQQASVRMVATPGPEAGRPAPAEDVPHTDQTLRNFLHLIDHIAPFAPAAAVLRQALEPARREHP